jgi:hypothetical protein
MWHLPYFDIKVTCAMTISAFLCVKFLHHDNPKEKKGNILLQVPHFFTQH